MTGQNFAETGANAVLTDTVTVDGTTYLRWHPGQCRRLKLKLQMIQQAKQGLHRLLLLDGHFSAST